MLTLYFYFLFTVNSCKKNEEPQDSDSKGDIRHLEQLYGKNWSDDTVRIYDISHRVTPII